MLWIYTGRIYGRTKIRQCFIDEVYHILLIYVHYRQSEYFYYKVLWSSCFRLSTGILQKGHINGAVVTITNLGFILCLRPANERRRYFVTGSYWRQSSHCWYFLVQYNIRSSFLLIVWFKMIIYKLYDDTMPWKRFPHYWLCIQIFFFFLAWTSCVSSSWVAGDYIHHYCSSDANDTYWK